MLPYIQGQKKKFAGLVKDLEYKWQLYHAQCYVAYSQENQEKTYMKLSTGIPLLRIFARTLC
jgi:hypothetical protein